MPKVREVFERAYGPVPEGATCHVGAVYNDGQFFSVGGFSVKTPYHEPVYAASNRQQCVRRNALDNQWNERVTIGEPIGGDIGDQPAAAFSPVFGCAAYDAALDALTKEESATAINRTMRKYDLALHKLAKSSEVTKAQPDPRTVIALADGIAGIAYELLQSHEYAHGGETPYSLHLEAQIDRYMEASREFWAALSADGTGESPVLSTHLDVMGEGK